MASRESQAPDPAVVAELFATSRELIQRASATIRQARRLRDHHRSGDSHDPADPFHFQGNGTAGAGDVQESAGS
jgi:hypothetical protein